MRVFDLVAAATVVDIGRHQAEINFGHTATRPLGHTASQTCRLFRQAHLMLMHKYFRIYSPIFKSYQRKIWVSKFFLEKSENFEPTSFSSKVKKFPKICLTFFCYPDLFSKSYKCHHHHQFHHFFYQSHMVAYDTAPKGAFITDVMQK